VDLFYIHLSFSDDLKTYIRYKIEDKSRMITKLPEILQKQQLKVEIIFNAFFHSFSVLLNGAYASKFETGWEP
jgi:hypothetical protein